MKVKKKPRKYLCSFNFKIFYRVLGLFILSLWLDMGTSMAGRVSPKKLGQVGRWTSYQATENGKPICYMVGSPLSTEGKYAKRGKVYALITHRPSQNSFDVVSFHFGYPFQENATVSVVVSGKKEQKMKLFTDGEIAWCPDAKTDRQLVDLLLKSESATLKGTSSKGTPTTDVYSLSGTQVMYKMICQACKVKKS